MRAACVFAAAHFLRTFREFDEVATAGYTMLDMSVRYWLPFFEDRTPVALGFTAHNLLDEEARNAASFNKDRVLRPGRSFRVSVQASF